ncbi:hypothetical protein B0H13DRAFT_2101786 [Mycena leptocephala]|nr:hypothetical protein B0H13DRAFT_2101786 [Mycena leptocephala]
MRSGAVGVMGSGDTCDGHLVLLRISAYLAHWVGWYWGSSGISAPLGFGFEFRLGSFYISHNFIFHFFSFYSILYSRPFSLPAFLSTPTTPSLEYLCQSRSRR